MQYRLRHLLLLTFVVSMGLALYVSYREQADLETRLMIVRDLAPPLVNIERQETQIVCPQNLVLPNGEGYEIFEIYLPPGQRRWAYLIAGGDQSLGPLSGHLVLESQRRIDESGKHIRWHVRAWQIRDNDLWRAGQLRFEPTDLLGETTSVVTIGQTSGTRSNTRCAVWDKVDRVHAAGKHDGAIVVWSIYLYPTPNATSSDLRN